MWTAHKCVSALLAPTVDDGPSVYADRLLDLLGSHDVRVIFFVLGQSAERFGEASAGMIILAHDIHKITVAAMPAVVEPLASRGIHFVTVTELVGLPGPLSGRVYARGAAPR